MRFHHAPVLIFICLGLVSCTSKKDQLFQQLQSSYTGVTFRNDLETNDSLNAFTFTNFYNGGGVGVADFNLDGWPDICFTANQKAPELYLGKGRLQFEKVEQSGLENLGWVTGISIVDINQDGWPDIYLSTAQHHSFQRSGNQLYINQKKNIPSFKEEAAKYGLAYDGFTIQTAFFDYDLDGDLDAFLLNTAPDHSNPNILKPPAHDGNHPSSDKLYRNIGKQIDGTFLYEDVSKQAGIRYEGLGLGIALADFNQDGWTDIYCSNDFQSDDALYLNSADGTFKNVVKFVVKHTSLYGMGVDAADFNNDSFCDIFQLDMLPEHSERQKQMIARGDFDKLLLSLSDPYNYNLQYMRNSLQVNQGIINGLPYFSEQGFMHNVAATDWSWSVLLADFDLDGWKDAFITNGYRKNVTDLDFISYNEHLNMFGNTKTQEINRQQFLKEIPEIRLQNYAFKNIPKEGFQNVSKIWGLDDESYSNGAAYADLDQDGDLDLVVNNIDEQAFVYENLRGTGKNFIKVGLKGPEGNREGIGASIKACIGDACQVYDYFPVRGYLSSMNTPLVIGLGESSRLDRIEISWPGGKKQAIAEVKTGSSLIFDEADATIPPLVKDSSSGLVFKDAGILPGFHQKESDFVDFRLTPTQQKMLTRNGPAIAKGDFNGDNRTDLVIGGAYHGSPTVVFYQQSNGKFALMDTLPTNQMEVGAIAVLDANQDGINDVFVTPGASERPLTDSAAFLPLLFLGTKIGFTLDTLLPRLNICSESVLAEDFNMDGQIDILLGGSYIPMAYPNTCPSILLIQRNGKFLKEDRQWLPSNVAIKDMKALDIDQDNDLDIVFTGHWQGIGLLRKNGLEYTKEDLGLPEGWWNCIEMADIDFDGDQDLVIGNEGLNSVYKASLQQPLSLFTKDFNKDGRMDPILGLFLANKEVTIHPLGTLTEQIVQYKKRFTRFKDYSKSGLKDLFTANDLKGVNALRAVELRSGICLNNGKGSFTFNALPFEAQKSPTNDLLIEDFNGDEIPDLLLVGNFYPNEPIFGQSDGSFGTLLFGKSGGKFLYCPVPQSGLKLDGDVRKIIFLQHEKLIIITQNQGEVLTYSLQ